MTRSIVISVDQWSRPQPGGIGRYVTGLLTGLELVGGSERVVALGPRGTVAPAGMRTVVEALPLPISALTRLWAHFPLGVPRSADVVHATSMSGPFGGGRSDAVRSILFHDLLWRRYPEQWTARGVAFHERALEKVIATTDIRVLVTSPVTASEIEAAGVASERIHLVRLGSTPTPPGAHFDLAEFLQRRQLPAELAEGFTVAVGTREPRKNLTRLVNAHARARLSAPDLGPLVLVGPEGWGQLDTKDALVLGDLAQGDLDTIVAHARVAAYVPIEEGWGLPPVEYLRAGRPCVVSRNVPSVSENTEVVLVNPLEEDDIAAGLLRALKASDDEPSRLRRQLSVADHTWERCALDHLAAWR
ncbi:MAG: glycosyltransferase [Actinomycetota bacterium]